MCLRFTVKVLKIGPLRCAPRLGDRGSWEVNLGTKTMCWNQVFTSTSIRSKALNFLNKGERREDWEEKGRKHWREASCLDSNAKMEQIKVRACSIRWPLGIQD